MKKSKQLPIGTILKHPCPDCGSNMVLRNSKYGLFYGCVKYPECKASHGAHPDGKPLGTPATKEVKKARIEAHKAFDELWQNGDMKRREAYAWMQEAMELTDEESHIGMFTEEQYQELIKKVYDREEA